jgi:hypothetical protein
MSGIQVPDYMGEIAGARAWRMAPTLWAKMGGLIWAKVMTDRWIDGETKVAECERGHEVPHEGCSCGCYAWYTEDLLHRQKFAPTDHTTISGVVAGSGGVIRGHNGYWVAERVTVKAFFDDGFPSPVVEVQEGSGVFLATKAEAAEVWGVPVIQYSDYADFCDDLGLWRCDEKGEFL